MLPTFKDGPSDQQMDWRTTKWPTNWQIKPPTDRVTDCLTYWMTHRPAKWQTDWLSDSLIDHSNSLACNLRSDPPPPKEGKESLPCRLLPSVTCHFSQSILLYLSQSNFTGNCMYYTKHKSLLFFFFFVQRIGSLNTVLISTVPLFNSTKSK